MISYPPLWRKIRSLPSSPYRNAWIYVGLLCNLLMVFGQELNIRRDPTPIIYPGQVNIGILSNIHDASRDNSTNSGCGVLRGDAVQRVMSAVWAAHQVNFRKDDSQELNIGVYIFDTCGKEEVAQRQVYRILGHVGHVQTTRCSEKRIPPLFAIITEGDMDTLRVPSTLLDAFGIPIISTSGIFPPNPTTVIGNHLSTSPTTDALARAAVSVLRQLQLLEVAVIAEDDPPSLLFEEFSKEAQMSGMQALPVDHPSIVGDPDNFLASLQVVSEYGRSRLKAVVFLINSKQALDLLRSVDSSSLPQMPWVLVTQEDLAPMILKTFKRHQLRRLQQVLLLSPERSEIPEFQEYFQKLLQEDTIKYHPLLIEFAESLVGVANTDEKPNQLWRRISRQLRSQLQNITSEGSPNTNTTISDSNTSTTAKVLKKLTYEEADVSPMVKAMWTLAAALKTVQTRSCRRGTDCLLYLRRSLSSYVLKAARSLEHTLDETSGAQSLNGAKLSFGNDGILDSVRYSLKGFTARGDIQEVGWYSDETSLVVDHEVVSSFNGFVFKDSESAYESLTTPLSTQEPTSHFKFLPQYVTPNRTYLYTTLKSVDTTTFTSTETPVPQFDDRTSSLESLPLEEGSYTSWKILDDTDITRDFESTKGLNVPKSYKEPESSSPLTHAEDPLLHPVIPINHENHVFVDYIHDIHRANSDVNDSSNIHSSDYEIVLGPSYKSDQELPSSNLRSISLTSHHEPRINSGYNENKEDLFLLQESRSEFEDAPLARANVDRAVVGVAGIPPPEDVKVVSASRGLHISSWLARPWALTILGLCGFGILITLYVLVFIMVKSCEGTLKKTNTCVAVTQLLALLLMYVAAALFTWKPSPLLCGLQRLVPNVSYAFCFSCLLLKGMHLRAQNNLGLGGSVNKCNQMLTLLFMVGVQAALEAQWWFMRPPLMNHETLQCITTKEEILESQGYVSFLLLLGVIVAICTSKVPYSQNEGRSLVVTSSTCLLVFLSWDVACWLLPDVNCRNIAAPSTLIVTAIVVLVGIFGPQLFAIHKYGGFPHKPLSYADSLSTVFTMFKDLDNNSNSGTTGRGKKSAKTLETPFVNEIAEGTRNPLYSDYQSAYP